jgi:hypothetical protein
MRPNGSVVGSRRKRAFLGVTRQDRAGVTDEADAQLHLPRVNWSTSTMMTGRQLARAHFRAASFWGVAAIIALPLIGHLFFSPSTQSDNRTLAPPPSAPRTLSALMEWPRQADAYLKDHFGFRAQFVRAYATLSWKLFGTSPEPSVVVGRNDRLFLSDGDVHNRVLLGDCGAWWSDEQLAPWAVEGDAALRRLKAEFPRLSVFVVPTSAVLYPADLPPWMERACAGKTPFAQALAARLPPDTRSLITYPVLEAKDLPPATPLIPAHNFHWVGKGVDLLMAEYIESHFGLKRQIAPGWERATEPADLERFFPGSGLSNTILAPVWNPENVEFCFDGDCLQQPPLDRIRLPRETLRVSRSGAGEPILLLSDSFGAGAASSLIEYFRDVVMINMNNFQMLEEGDRRVLWRRLEENWGGSNVLVLIEDGNVTLPSRFVKSLPRE